MLIMGSIESTGGLYLGLINLSSEVTAIAALYTSPSAKVFANGVPSKPFMISNGTRQGCPPLPADF